MVSVFLVYLVLLSSHVSVGEDRLLAGPPFWAHRTTKWTKKAENKNRKIARISPRRWLYWARAQQKQSYLTPGGNQKSGFSVFSQSDSALKSGIIQLTEPIRFGFQLTEPIANVQNPTHGANHIHICECCRRWNVNAAAGGIWMLPPVKFCIFANAAAGGDMEIWIEDQLPEAITLKYFSLFCTLFILLVHI